MSRIIEPNAPVSSKRFDALKTLSINNIFTGILLMPVLPFIEDSKENISNIIDIAFKSGAKFIFPAFGVTLILNQRDCYYTKLDSHFPGTKEKYIVKYGNSYECQSLKANELWDLFKLKCDKYGILYRMSDIIEVYKRNYGLTQISWF